MNNEQKLRQLGWSLIPLVLALALGISTRPRELDSAMRGARVALESGSTGAAAGHIAKVAEFLPWRDSLWELAGQSAIQAGDPQAALAFIDNAIQSGNITPQGYLIQGDAYQLLGSQDAAIGSWLHAIESGADLVSAHSRLFQLYRANGNYLGALNHLITLSDLAPDNAQVRYQLGLFFAAREPQMGLFHIQQAAEMDAAFSGFAESFEKTIRSAEKEGDPAFTLVSTGRLLAGLDEWWLAAEAFSQAIELNPEYADAWAFLGEARQQTGKDGVEELRKALEIDPYSFVGNLLYGLHLKRAGNYVEALEYVTYASEYEPLSATLQAELASLYFESGDTAEALIRYQKAIELDPDNPVYLHLLAAFSIENDIQIEEIGMAAARNALLLDEGDAAALDLIGYGYYRLNDYLSAQRFLQQAVTLAPDNPDIRLHLGLLYLAQGDRDEAFSQLSLAISLAPDSRAAGQAERILSANFP